MVRPDNVALHFPNNGLIRKGPILLGNRLGREPLVKSKVALSSEGAQWISKRQKLAERWMDEMIDHDIIRKVNKNIKQ